MLVSLRNLDFNTEFMGQHIILANSSGNILSNCGLVDRQTINRVKKYSTHSIKTRWKLSWGTSQFKLIGITFDVDLTKIIGINYGNKMQTIKNSIKLWQRRALSPLGKITVIKSLLLPKITHLLIVLPKPGITLLQEINTLFYDFLWKGRAKIKQSVVVKQYFEGGLKMVNLFAFEQALKINWIRRMLQDDSK